MKITCCKDCPDRCVTVDYNCHSHCKTFENQKNRYEESKAALKAMNAVPDRIDVVTYPKSFNRFMAIRCFIR